MKTIIILLTVLIATTALIAGTAVAKGKNPEKIVERVTEKLSLDSSQQAAFRILIDEKQKLRAKRKAQRQARKEQFKVAKENGERTKKGPFSELSQQEQISVADINRVIDEKQAKRRENQQPVLQAFVDFRNSLNTEQRQQARHIFHKILRGVVAGHGRKHRHH